MPSVKSFTLNIADTLIHSLHDLIVAAVGNSDIMTEFQELYLTADSGNGGSTINIGGSDMTISSSGSTGAPQMISGMGTMNLITLTNPAAGAEWTYTIPAGNYWIPYVISQTFGASINAASRNLGILIMAGATTLYYDLTQNAVTASQNLLVAWYRLLGSANETIVPNGGMSRPLPDLKLLPGYVLKSNTTARQSNDQYTSVFMYVEQFATSSVSKASASLLPGAVKSYSTTTRGKVYSKSIYVQASASPSILRVEGVQ